MNTISYAGWDIGGAHLKVACVDEAGKLDFVKQYPTPLWQGLNKLEHQFPLALKQLSSETTRHAVTMTAELVDIFTDREAGIKSLIKVTQNYLGDKIRFYSSNRDLLNISTAQNESASLASANWHASASFVSKIRDEGLFIDLGSTTTDIIPFKNGEIINLGNDDHSRMRQDELLYTGVIRTPLMALTQKVPFAGEWQSIAAENFSTTADVYRILGYLNESDDLMETPDGKPKDIPSSIRRMARMLGLDVTMTADSHKWKQLANYFADIQLQMIKNAMFRVMSTSLANRTPIIVGAGVGSFLIKRIAEDMKLEYTEFYELLESNASLQHECNTCAPAVALAQLNRMACLK